MLPTRNKELPLSENTLTFTTFSLLFCFRKYAAFRIIIRHTMSYQTWQTTWMQQYTNSSRFTQQKIWILSYLFEIWRIYLTYCKLKSIPTITNTFQFNSGHLPACRPSWVPLRSAICMTWYSVSLPCLWLSLISAMQQTITRRLWNIYQTFFFFLLLLLLFVWCVTTSNMKAINIDCLFFRYIVFDFSQI
jgi:hypothetical protein